MAVTATKEQAREQLNSIVAGLASRQAEAPRPTRELSGPERAAVLMLALGDEYGGKIWELLDDDELRDLSVAMDHVDLLDRTSLAREIMGGAKAWVAGRSRKRTGMPRSSAHRAATHSGENRASG